LIVIEREEKKKKRRKKKKEREREKKVQPLSTHIVVSFAGWNENQTWEPELGHRIQR
jgi:hypothetical protein